MDAFEFKAASLMFADQRWYSSTLGRFLTPDPYQASGGVANPQSWNRYAYVENDPVNFHDPAGLFRRAPLPPVPEPPPLGSTPSHDRPDIADDGGGGTPTEPKWSEYMRIVEFAFQDRKCRGLFSTKYDPAEVLRGMLLGRKIGEEDYGFLMAHKLRPDFLAATEPSTGTWEGKEYVYTTANIVLQGSGRNAFYRQTSQSVAETLIHELGHVFNIVERLGGSAIKYDANADGSANDRAQEENAKALKPCAEAIQRYRP